MTRFFILVLSAFCSGCAFSQSTWDTLFLRNGQTVYGELKGIALGKVKFDMEGLTETSVKMNKIKTIHAAMKLYRIETINKQVFFSKLNQSAKAGYVLVGDSTGGAEVPLDYLSFVSYYSSKRNLFEGSVSVGYNFTKSSDIGRFNVDNTMRYIMKKFTISNNASAILTQENGIWERDRETFLLSGTYLINSNWKAILLFNYQLNRELGLQYRFQEGLAIGHSLLSKSQLRFAAVTGTVVNQEKSFESSPANLTYEIPFILTFDFFKFSKPELTLAVDSYSFVSLTQKGRIRQDGEIRFDWEVISDFKVNLKLYYSYDNKPLSGQGASSDYGIVFGIGYKWE